MTIILKIKPVQNLKKVILMVSICVFFAYPFGAAAFTCKDATGKEIKNPANAVNDIYVNLNPTLQPGKVLVADVASSISCKSDMPGIRNNYVSITAGSTFSGVLNKLSGSLEYYGVNHPLPVQTQTNNHNFTNGSYNPLKARVLLTPITAAGGILINAGDKIATLIMSQIGNDIGTGGRQDQHYFTWNLHAANTVVLPTGGCDVSARNITVTLPDYPGTMAVPVTVHCAQKQNLVYYLTGTTVDSGNSIFRNTASASPAKGIGVQMTRYGTVVPANSNVPLGRVGSSPVNLGLTATYARTSGQVTTGNVQSIIGVTFVYQ
ncbi:fimbrial chaperone protein [Salmonella enterica subsp. enterica]|uniref:fimbrial protein n=1 Tax=Salmonella enterica TaxID=28901 RepID=UPI000DA3FD06|nr:fimbrial protein [Salmonella enterica]SQI06485.1 fimbrial chaperone protein [Salmonella enterica subsp. enterica] [Salmonella enterica subsp. enterica serovar Sundsvall]